jgi:hypothetical protein
MSPTEAISDELHWCWVAKEIGFGGRDLGEDRRDHACLPQTGTKHDANELWEVSDRPK